MFRQYKFYRVKATITMGIILLNKVAASLWSSLQLGMVVNSILYILLYKPN